MPPTQAVAQDGRIPAQHGTPTTGGAVAPPPQQQQSENGSGKREISIRDIVTDGKPKNGSTSSANSGGQPERSAADIDMVSALNRTSRR